MIEWFYTGVFVSTVCFCIDYFIFDERLDAETKKDFKNNPQKLIAILILLAFIFPVVIISEIYNLYKRLTK